jgi:hypothetical protein
MGAKMIHCHRPGRALKLLIIFTLICAAGCYSDPKMLSQAHLDDPNVRAEKAGYYWERHGQRQLSTPQGAKIAIASFSCEFVVAKMEGYFGGSGWAITPPPTSIIGLAFQATEFTGLGRKQAVITPEFMQTETDHAYKEVVDLLQKQGAQVVPIDAVAAARAYKNYQTTELGATDWMQEMNWFVGSDTGRVKRMVTVPVTNSRAIVGAVTGMSIEEVDRSVAKELGVDRVVRVRLRIGVYEGHASLNMGTRIYSASSSDNSQFFVRRSLLSDNVVLKGEASYDIVKGKINEIDDEKYAAGIEQLLPPMMSMVFLIPTERPAVYLPCAGGWFGQ